MPDVPLTVRQLLEACDTAGTDLDTVIRIDGWSNVAVAVEAGPHYVVLSTND
jgi:hypothetical protein